MSAEFFSSVVTGQSGKPTTGKAYAPTLPVKDAEFAEEYYRHLGNFDMHIAMSIPGFREVQANIGAAIVDVYPYGSRMLDMGASEGALIKAVAWHSRGKVHTRGIDTNVDMWAAWADGGRVHGCDYYLGRVHEYPKGLNYDVVHAAMLFQFISPRRLAHFEMVKTHLGPDGLFIIEEKLFEPVGSPHRKQWEANEAEKDAYKLQYFSQADMTKKSDTVLADMHQNMLSEYQFEKALTDTFLYWCRYWSAGNFVGYAASDNRLTVEAVTNSLEEF